MNITNYQHEVIVPNEGFPFKLFLFEGQNGKYVRDRHWHRSIEIFAVSEGQLDFTLNEEQYTLHADEFIIVNSNEVHAIHAAEKNRTIVLQIPLQQFAAYFTSEQFIWFTHSERRYDAVVSALISEIYAQYGHKASGYEFMVLSEFYRLQYYLVTKYRKLEVDDDIVKSNKQLIGLGAITQYIQSHYSEEITLEKLAVIFGYSTSYLSRMFLWYAKINYKDYLGNVRLEHAVQELEHTEDAIGDIALKHGFVNSKSFANRFRKRYGILPNEYRKKLKTEKGQKSDITKSING